jgi:hypothetical protein
MNELSARQLTEEFAGYVHRRAESSGTEGYLSSTLSKIICFQEISSRHRGTLMDESEIADAPSDIHLIVTGVLASK